MAADSMKAIKSRIKSVESTMQITKAMELVATSKLRRAKERIERSRPFFEVLRKAILAISEDTDLARFSPYCAPREGRACHIVIAGDRGLAGGYNNNLFRSLNPDDGDLIFPIGKKCVEYYEHHGFELFTKAYSVVEDVSVSECAHIGAQIAKAFDAKRFARLDIAYTSYINVLTQQPVIIDVLPIVRTEEDEEKEKRALTVYEPSPEEAIANLVPRYISGIVYCAVSESFASELSARRTAMEAANKNAGEMIDELSLRYNRARQAAITQEITEIVAGAEA
ncbi:MAG: ATP synthase F1 subunit gamma [Clostridia bacterium]|nr:ATP synthase F1 subunit gamma [Clostridia bacterium]